MTDQLAARVAALEAMMQLVDKVARTALFHALVSRGCAVALLSRVGEKDAEVPTVDEIMEIVGPTIEGLFDVPGARNDVANLFEDLATVAQYRRRGS